MGRLGAARVRPMRGCQKLWMRVVGLGLALGLSCSVPAGAGTPQFSLVTEPGALRDNIVSALALDEQGLLWLGTPDGVHRFDGYSLKRYPLTDASQAPLHDQFTRALLNDPRGGLWMSAGNIGLARLDRSTGQWQRWQRGAGVADERAPISNAVRAFAQEADGALWLGTLGGLDRLDAARQRFSHVPTAQAGLPDERIASLLIDSRGILWAGTWRGLARKAPGSEVFKTIPLGLDQPQISLIAETRDRRVLIGTQRGELRVLSSDGDVLPFAERVGDGEEASSVLSMVQTGEREIWIGHTGGIERLHDQDGRLIERLPPRGGSALALSRSEVRALLRDASGTVWAGNFGGGLLRHVPPLPGVRLIQNDVEHWRREGDLDVRSVLQLSGGEVWLGTAGSGIVQLDRALVRTGSLPLRGRISAMAQTRDGSVWLGVEDQLLRLDAKGRLLERKSQGLQAVRRLHTTADGSLWVGTRDGLWRWRPSTQILAPIALAGEGTPLVRGEINGFSNADDGSLWVGGAGGLLRIAEPAAEHASAQGQRAPGLAGQTVVGLHWDARGRLWVDTGAGLHRLTGRAGGSADGELSFTLALPRPGAFGANLLSDRFGRVWSQRGVFDPESGQSHRLSSADGADLGTGWFRAFAVMDDGQLLFGGARGLLAINPDRFAPWGFEPGVVASELQVDDIEHPLPRPGEPLVIEPEKQGFTLAFTAPDFSDPARNRYRYRLEGLDRDWREVSAVARSAAYTNLAPGPYTMRVQASNRAGQWSSQELSLAVEVQAEWWETRWAQALAVLLGLALLAGVVRLRTGLLLRRQRTLEAHVVERTHELAAATTALQRQAEAFEDASLTDALTGLRNRRYLLDRVEADCASSLRRHLSALATGRPARDADLIFFLVDLDHFKRLNDERGHAAGDAALRQMRDRLVQVFRQGDHLVRWGGEEFLIVVRDTDRRHAAELAERLRALVEQAPFQAPDGSGMAVSCSVGFACYPPLPSLPGAFDWHAVVALADAALFAAKRQGRNRWLGLREVRGTELPALREALARPAETWAQQPGWVVDAPGAEP